MNKVETKIAGFGVVPVVVLAEARHAAPLAEALTEGGLPCAEITFRTQAAEEGIRIMTKQYPEILVGAGTVLTLSQVDAAVAAGAQFIVSPGFDPEIVDYCMKRNILVFPGCVTPSEAARAVRRGLKTVKFFPAESFGGVRTIEAISAPYQNLRFMPTGGINIKNLEQYLTSEKVLACGGSWMIRPDFIRDGRFGEIRDKVQETVRLVVQIRNKSVQTA